VFPSQVAYLPSLAKIKTLHRTQTDVTFAECFIVNFIAIAIDYKALMKFDFFHELLRELLEDSKKQVICESLTGCFPSKIVNVGKFS